MLESLDIPDETKTNLNLSSNYIGKDILGQIGGVIIMNKMGKYIDSDPRKFLNCSLLFQQTALTIECLTPLFPHSYFLFLGASGNILKNISFMGFSSLNGKIINKLSIDKDNIGELYSKLTIINTISTSIGMSLGLYLTILIPCHFSRLGLIPTLGIIRYYSIHKSIKDIY
jgi:hypothetical protein